MAIADAFMDLMWGIFNLEESEIMKERHGEELLVKLSLEHHMLHGLKFDSSSFDLILWQ